MKVEYIGPDKELSMYTIYGVVFQVFEDLTALVEWHTYRGIFTQSVPIHCLEPVV